MIPNPIPKGTTREQWERFHLDLLNHETRIRNKRAFLHEVLEYAGANGIQSALKHFYYEIDREQSMDRPNEPGYYRANND